MDYIILGETTTAAERNLERKHLLDESDPGIFRGVDDILQILLDNTTVVPAEISTQLQAKLDARKALRDAMEPE